MATDNQQSFDVYLGRESDFPVNVAFRDGIYKIPKNFILDGSKAVILFSGSLLDNAPNGNIIQGTTNRGNSVGSDVTDSLILGSTNASLSGSETVRSGILLSGEESADVTINNADQSLILCSINSAIEPLDPVYTTDEIRLRRNKIIGCNQCYIRGGTTQQATMLDCYNSTIQGDNTDPDDYRLVYATMIGSLSCNITKSELTGQKNGIVILSGNNCTINDSSFSAILTSRFSNIDNNSLKCYIESSENATITGCNDVKVSGKNAPSAVGVDNCVIVDTTAVTDNQFRVGTDFHVDNQNITADDGYIKTNQGFLSNYVETTSDYTLSLSDHTVHLNSATPIFLYLPSPASLGALLPLNTVRTFVVIGNATANPSYIQTTGTPGHFLNRKSGWNQHRLSATGGRNTLQLVNIATNPYWMITDEVYYTCFAYTETDNYFGLVPPQSDANQLPTSTSEANHKTLGATSYYTFTNMTNNNPSSFSIASPPGVTIQEIGVYTITYQIDFDVNGGTGNYIIRADLLNTVTGQSILNSYTEVGGRNTVGGSQRISVTSNAFGTVAGNNLIHLRISQDATSTITATANIARVSMIIEGKI